MDRYLTALRSKRDDVQAAIDEEYARPHPDGIILTGLKKIKLRLRERIDRIERARQLRKSNDTSGHPMGPMQPT